MIESANAEKKVWVAPALDELAIEKTLGGTLVTKNESFILNQTPPLGPVFGSIPG